MQCLPRRRPGTNTKVRTLVQVTRYCKCIEDLDERVEINRDVKKEMLNSVSFYLWTALGSGSSEDEPRDRSRSRSPPPQFREPSKLAEFPDFAQYHIEIPSRNYAGLCQEVRKASADQNNTAPQKHRH